MSHPEMLIAQTQSDHMQQARKLFGFALRNSAEDTYLAAGSPHINALPRAITDHTATAYREQFDAVPDAEHLFLYGVYDTSRLITPLLDMHRSLPKEVALKIAQHPDTVMSHAIAANQSSARAGEMIYNYPGHAFALGPDEDAVYITNPDVELRENRGCVAVRVENDEVLAEPIFKRFTVWAGEIAVHSYFDHLSR